MNIRMLIALLVVTVSVCARGGTPDLSWDVETTALSLGQIEIRRGETVTLTPRYLQNSAPLALTNSESCVLYYRSSALAAGLYHVITGAVWNATNGQVRVTWTGANSPSSATNLQAEFVVSSTNAINLRAYATIVLRDSVFAQATTPVNPPTVTASDVSVLTGRVAGALINAPDLAWDVETSRIAATGLEIRRGETVTLTPRFFLNSTTLPVSTSAVAALYYRHAAMPAGQFYVAPGMIHSATGGQVRIPWTAANCPSATNLYGEIVVVAPGVTNLRAAVSIRLQDSVFGAAVAPADPAAWRMIDWATTTNLNLASAPFPTSTTAYASYGTIQGPASESTSLVAYVAAQIAASPSATETDPFSLHTQSTYTAWTSAGGTYSTNAVIPGPLLTNGYAGATYDSAGGLITFQTSTDSNTWASATATGSPVYVRISITAIGPGSSGISNVVVSSWTRPALVGLQSDLQGQIVLTDTPTQTRQIANRGYVDAAVAGCTPSTWSQYPASTNVTLAGRQLQFGSGFSTFSAGGYTAWSYTPATMSAGTDEVWRLQYGGQDILRCIPSYTLLAITNFALGSDQHFTAAVWTGGVTATPYIQVTTNLMSPDWQVVSLTSSSYPTESPAGSYALTWTNIWSGQAFFRSACGSATSNRLQVLWPMQVDQPGGNVVTNGGATTPSWAAPDTLTLTSHVAYVSAALPSAVGRRVRVTGLTTNANSALADVALYDAASNLTDRLASWYDLNLSVANSISNCDAGATNIYVNGLNAKKGSLLEIAGPNQSTEYVEMESTASTITNAWATNTSTAAGWVSALCVYNGKLYMGQGDGAGSTVGKVYVYDGSTWNISYNGTQNEVRCLCVYNGKLYGGTGNSAGYGDVIVFDGSTWTTNYDGAQEEIYSLCVYNGKLYAGQGSGTGDGDILVYDGSTWSVAYNGDNPRIASLGVYNGKLYAGQGSGAANGRILVFDGSEWNTTYFANAQEEISSFGWFNGRLYAGQGNGTSDGDVLTYDGGAWGLSYDGGRAFMLALCHYNGKLYSAQRGYSGGDGDVYEFDGKTWRISFDGSLLGFCSLCVYNGKLYAGQGMAGGSAAVLSMATAQAVTLKRPLSYGHTNFTVAVVNQLPVSALATNLMIEARSNQYGPTNVLQMRVTTEVLR